MKKNLTISVMTILFIVSSLTAYNLYISNNNMHKTLQSDRKIINIYTNYYKNTEKFIDYLSNEYAINILDVESETDEGSSYLSSLSSVDSLSRTPIK